MQALNVLDKIEKNFEEKKIETVLDGIFDIYDTALIYLHNDMCRLDVAVKDLNGDKYFNRCILLHLTDYIRKTHDSNKRFL